MSSPSRPPTRLDIDAARLYRSLADLKEIGSYRCERTGLTGVRRLALTDEDAAGRRLVRSWFEEAGLRVSVDEIGNVFAERAGDDPSLAPVMMGSHIDSVATGGAFDGSLGVLGALEVVRTLDDAEASTRRPLVCAFFTDEEGCRFGTDMLGSAVATGRIALAQAYANVDRDGRTVRQELERIGFLGDEPVGRRRPHAYLECHIEQGPILAAEAVDAGVVTGVQAISWHEVAIAGRSAHAGTTPIPYRRDPGLTAARVQIALREMATSGRYGDMRATVGFIRHEPGLVNVIPNRVTMTVDLRNPDDDRMAASERDLLALFQRLADDDGVEISHRQTARTAAVSFDNDVQRRIATHADARQLSNAPILSGAGHDAQEWARVCPTGMIFVPGEHDGISHNPRELSTEKQCGDGVNLLLDVAVELANAT